MLLLLQRRGRSTAGQLAETLEVSERTVLRDVEALSEAGVPIFATQGAGGGIELVDGFETRLTGLLEDEARSLFLAGQPEVARRLGLDTAARTARHKLLGALESDLREQAASLDSWFLHDPDPWEGCGVPLVELRRLARCIRRRRQVELYHDDAPAAVVRPLGLVLKAGSWQLVVAGRRTLEVVDLEGLKATRITRQPFSAPEGFQLADFWRQHLSRSPGERGAAERKPRRRAAGRPPGGPALGPVTEAGRKR